MKKKRFQYLVWVRVLGRAKAFGWIVISLYRPAVDDP